MSKSSEEQADGRLSFLLSQPRAGVKVAEGRGREVLLSKSRFP